MKYLFSEFKTNKIIAICIDKNTDSYRLMEKLGMQRSSKKLPTVQIGGVEMVQVEYFITKNMWDASAVARSLSYYSGFNNGSV